ncbi:MAG: hypothetical protein Q4D85_09480 [Corynebacterium sp.]|uniref:Roadblock/LAMTOR2 domain-containing protein n=1 Tax=Corynebacterium mustelae TaxID=571915 RepID=A0A0G3GW25_9CORY|nr:MULTISPECIES: hypothetical protein [Corynebacterium]AKK04710.1 hypothetical protein CMUST_01805 [Corynebacterium mustelae]MDO5098980.1 hypothetical protein [Corynebacterium sp.]
MTDEILARHRRVRGRDFGTNDIAAAALPLLSRLRNQYPGIYSIILGTGDGIHVCSIGFNSTDDASRMAALNSSMLAVSLAQAQVIDPLKSELRETVVAVELPDNEFLGMARIEHPPVGHLVLGLFARNTQLGMAVHQAQAIAKALHDWLEEV